MKTSKSVYPLRSDTYGNMPITLIICAVGKFDPNAILRVQFDPCGSMNMLIIYYSSLSIRSLYF